MRPIRTSLAAFALAIVMPVATGFAAQDGGPKPVMAEPDACSVSQLTVIEEAFTEAARRTARALAFLDAEPNHPHVQRWFGTAQRKLVRVNLALTAAALEPGSRPRLSCDARTRLCSTAIATANRYNKTINFCPSFFEHSGDGQDARFGVVVHEVSHVAAGTRDAAYQPGNVETLAKEEPVVAVSNADSYEYFVEMLPR